MLAQLLKIILIALIIYALISLVRFLVGIGRAVNAGRARGARGPRSAGRARCAVGP